MQVLCGWFYITEINILSCDVFNQIILPDKTQGVWLVLSADITMWIISYVPLH